MYDYILFFTPASYGGNKILLHIAIVILVFFSYHLLSFIIINILFIFLCSFTGHGLVVITFSIENFLVLE